MAQESAAANESLSLPEGSNTSAAIDLQSGSEADSACICALPKR
jgi:hypothetical protein